MADPTPLRGLRASYRPATTRVLMVGESAPAGGTHYYYANSILYSGITEAFRRVYGKVTPQGPEFLDFARERGFWLIDLANTPVNRLGRAERQHLIGRGAPRVTRLIRETAPEFVVAAVIRISGTVAGCLERSGVEAELVTLPFPTRQWRESFIDGLATTLRRARKRAPASR